jgi:hypothetical protein
LVLVWTVLFVAASQLHVPDLSSVRSLRVAWRGLVCRLVLRWLGAWVPPEQVRYCWSFQQSLPGYSEDFGWD